LRDIITPDCEVINFHNEKFVYPIFKNGRSSLTIYANKNKLSFLRNEEISHVKKITVFLRPAKERFLSGVHTFFYLHKNQLIDDSTLKKIESFDIIDRHFVPQYYWLYHLFKYYDGIIELKPVEELYKWIPNRDGPWSGNASVWKPLTKEIKDKILSIEHKKYIEVDEKIIGAYMNQSVQLKKIIAEFKI